MLSLGRSRTIAKHTGFRGFLWVGSSCWEEVALFHCKSCAFSRSKPHYCQTHWFQKFFVGWLVILGRGGSLSLQELCFQSVEAARWPNTVVSEVFWLMMMGKGVFLSLFGEVLLIGGVVWGFGCGFGWGVRGVLRIVFLIPANPYQAQSVVLQSLFLAI